MLRRCLLLFLVLGMGCAQGNSSQVDPCKRALERLVNECNFEIVGVQQLNTYCTGQSACVASCLESSPCPDIRNKSGEYADCIDDCAQ